MELSERNAHGILFLNSFSSRDPVLRASSSEANFLQFCQELSQEMGVSLRRKHSFASLHCCVCWKGLPEPSLSQEWQFSDLKCSRSSQSQLWPSWSYMEKLEPCYLLLISEVQCSSCKLMEVLEKGISFESYTKSSLPTARPQGDKNCNSEKNSQYTY